MSDDTWATPDELYDPLNDEFKFEFDLCADEENTKCISWSSYIENFVTLSDVVSQFDSFWINPPYSRGNINIAVECVSKLNDLGKTIVSLTRFDPTADWFKLYVDGVASEVRMLDRRVKFVGASSGYPFPCCVSIYRGFTPKFTHYYSWGWK